MEQEDIQKKESKGAHVLVSLSVYVVAFLFLSVVFSMLGYIVIGLPGTSSLTLSQYAIIQSATLLAAVLPAYFILKYFDHRPLSDLGLSIKGRGRDILYGLLAAVVLYGVGFGLSLLSGEVKVTGVQLSVVDLAGSFGVFILVALTEEIMVRGYILGRLLRTRLNKFLSLGITANSFSLMHFFNPNVAFLPLLNLVLAGCLLGVTFLYTRNLWFPISLHLFWNWLQGPVLGYKVSGTILCSSLLQLQFPDNNILNGGDFGFEGSIICTVLMILMTGCIIWYFERKKQMSF